MLGLAPLNALRAFEAAARRGSFAAAAQELNVTPAAVGQHVRQLEALIGATLFHRAGRTLQLTERGEEALPPLQRGFELVGEASAALRQPNVDRVISLAAPASLLSLWVGKDIAGWTGKASLTLQALSPDQSRSGIPDTEADIALTIGPKPIAGSIHAMEEVLTPLAAPSLISGGSDFERLLETPLIEDSSLGLTWSQWAAARGAFGEGIKPTLTVPDTVTSLSLAIAGAGIVLAPKSLAFDAIRDGQLSPVLPDGEMKSGAAYHISVSPGSARREPVISLANHLKRCATARLDAAGEL